MGAPPVVLVLVKGLGIGGAEKLLSEGARFWDRDRFEYHVAYVLPWKDQLVGEFERPGRDLRRRAHHQRRSPLTRQAGSPGLGRIRNRKRVNPHKRPPSISTPPADSVYAGRSSNVRRNGAVWSRTIRVHRTTTFTPRI